MDILSDILNSAGLAVPSLQQLTFYTPRAEKFRCEKSMGFHLIAKGEAYIRWECGRAPLHLKRGDIVMIKRGLGHEVATDLETQAQEIAAGDTPSAHHPENDRPLVSLVSGYYQFRTEPIHPLFAELPDQIHIRSDDIAPHSPLYIAQQLLSAEIAHDGPGSQAIIKSLVDMLFHYILREWIAQREGDGQSWSRALKDTHLQKAITAMHAEPSRDWSVDDLAGTAGISRAAFAQKFKRISGDTPAHYLTKLRIQSAMDMLRTADDSVERIAEAVGYNDSFVFSKAFKRIQGLSPKEFRKSLA
jgi:AraC-like DNA-binding protein